MKTIIAAIDFSDQSRVVIQSAHELARSLGASLEVLHVVAPEPDFVGYSAYAYPGRDERADELRNEKEMLQKIVDGLEKEGITVRAFMKEAPTAEGILEFAEHHRANYIVLGKHSRGLLERLFVGSTVQAVIKRSPIPVVVVPSEG